jgi:ferritin
MVSKQLEKAFCDQVQAELYSAYLYLGMSASFESMNLKGFAGWMMVQAQEEQLHAMKFYHHILDRKGEVQLKVIDAPEQKFKSALEIFEVALKHEQYVTKRIKDLYEITMTEKDYESLSLLQWFLNEQIEEESTVEDIVQQLKLLKDNPHGLLMLDRELGQRQTEPVTEETA